MNRLFAPTTRCLYLKAFFIANQGLHAWLDLNQTHSQIAGCVSQRYIRTTIETYALVAIAPDAQSHGRWPDVEHVSSQTWLVCLVAGLSHRCRPLAKAKAPSSKASPRTAPDRQPIRNVPVLDASNPANSVGSHGSAQQAAQAPTAITGIIDNFFMATPGCCDKGIGLLNSL